MSHFAQSLRMSWNAISEGLRVPGFYVLLVASLATWALAYQGKTVYTVDVGGPSDNAYVSGFHDKEHNATLNYRWSGPRSVVRFPGIGNEPVTLSVATVGYRPDGAAPLVKIEARGQIFSLQSREEPHTDALPIAKGSWFDSGDLTVVITSPTFSPANDPRRLGVIVDSVSVAPAGYGLRPIVVPSLGTMGGLLAGLVGMYLSAVAATRRKAVASGATAILAATFAYLIIASRPELALLAAQLPSLFAWGLALALLGRACLDTLQVAPLSRSSEMASAVGSMAFVMGFLLRFGGTTYPQFLSSDLLLHVHNVQHVLSGQWLFTEPLPDGTLVPYPNALYVLLSPFALLLGRSDEVIGLLLKWSAALFDSATCLALAWAGTRLWPGRAGAIGALVYAVSPAPFVLLSAGNFSNIFAQAALNVTLLGGMVFLGSAVTAHALPFRIHVSRFTFRLSSALLLTGGFCLTMLGHYGMMLATLGIMLIFGVLAGWETIRRGRAPEAWVLMGAWAMALLLSFGVYYWHFLAEMWGQWSGVLRRTLGRSAAGSTTSEQTTGGLADFAAKRLPWVGPLAALTALLGTTRLGGLTRLSRALLLSWLAAALVFALLDQVLGDTIRWYYLAAAPIAVLAGRYLSALASRRRAATLLAALSLLAMLVHTLDFWVGDLIFTRYH